MSLRINKAAYLAALSCPRLGWFAIHGTRGEVDTGLNQFRINEGRYVEKLAREEFPDGVMVAGKSGEKSAEETHKLMKEEKTIFEGVIQSGPFTTRPDILIPLEDNKWKLIEIKSALAPKEKKQKATKKRTKKPKLSTTTTTRSPTSFKYIYDVAYTYMVLQQKGIEVSECSLYLINPAYTLPNTPTTSSDTHPSLFTPVDITTEVLSLYSSFRFSPSTIIFSLSSSSSPPSPFFSSTCRGCPYFSHCWGSSLHSVTTLPSLTFPKLSALWQDGVREIGDLKGERKKELNTQQQLVVKGVEKGRLVVREKEEVIKKVAELDNFPLYFLDFEAFMLPVPVFEGDTPYTPTLSQVSIHVAPGPNQPVEHVDYVVPPGEDGRETIAKLLLETLSDSSPILVWGAAFESARIKDLAQRYPSLSTPLLSLIPRMVDLMTLFRSKIYHPKMSGKYSLKNVVHALLPPSLSYKNLSVADGESAMGAYGERIRRVHGKERDGEREGEELEEWEKVEKDLRDYCKHDTLVMVEILRYLVDYCGVGPKLGSVNVDHMNNIDHNNDNNNNINNE